MNYIKALKKKKNQNTEGAEDQGKIKNARKENDIF